MQVCDEMNYLGPNDCIFSGLDDSTQISTITMYMGGIGHYVHGYWPQPSGQSQSVNHDISFLFTPYLTTLVK